MNRWNYCSSMPVIYLEPLEQKHCLLIILLGLPVLLPLLENPPAENVAEGKGFLILRLLPQLS